MTFALDLITIAVPDVRAAHAFYTAAFSPSDVADHGGWVDLDLHGTGHIGLYGTDDLAAETGAEPATSRFGGAVLSVVVDQPSEVEALVASAAEQGAEILKPAKKGFFGGFSAVYRAPDGAVWKLAAPTKKDTGPAASPPAPTETAVFLGVADPQTSKAFYEALGMTVDRDYGDKFVDFTIEPGKCRLGLLPSRSLAKDAGLDEETAANPAVVCNRTVASREEVDAVMTTAVEAGGRVEIEAGERDWGGYSGHFADPDGFLWKIACA
ncbi:glyoxalase [Glycomyces halotolerans]